MEEPRIKAKLWTQMALRLADGVGRSGAVVRSGDPDSGGILCVLRGREGFVVLAQAPRCARRGLPGCAAPVL